MSVPMSTAENVTAATTTTVNATVASFIVETTTLLNNLTSTVVNNSSGNANSNSSIITSSFGNHSSSGAGILQSSEDDGDTHRNPELKYFSTVIIIFMGLTILIVPVFCFIGVVCARARIFKTVREVAGRGWGFTDADVPYAEFGSDDYSKDKPDGSAGASGSSSSRNCDVKVLVAEDNRIASSRKRDSFLRIHSDDEEDISSLPPTFVHNSA